MEDHKIRENPQNPSHPRFRRYPEYKESGVEWIGGVPAHWEVKRLKYVAEILPSNVDKHIYPDEIQVRLCNYTDVYYNNYITVDTILEKGSCNEREFTKFVLRKGNVIITKDSETSDDIGVPTFVKDDLDTVVCGYHLTMIRPLACHGEFIFRFIQSDRTRRYFEVNSNGITRYGLGKASIENLFLPIPPDSEQTQIANFLDCKTEQIDELIRIKERRIALLQEQRTALINQTVTKGLDPNVEMKPSGVEWIGEIPKHWEITKLRHLGILQNGISKDSGSFGLGYPFLSYGDVYNNETLPTRVRGLVKSTEVDRERYAVMEKDVFFTRTSETIEEIGISSTCMKTIENCVFSGFLIRFRNTSEVLTKEFSKYYFPSRLPRIFLAREVNIVTRSSLSQELLKRLPVLLPPMDEQEEIANFLDHKTRQIDELVATEQRKIELLKEYRQSLISETVTGKIDVRDEV